MPQNPYLESLTKRLLLAAEDDSEVLKSLMIIEQKMGRRLTAPEAEEAIRRLVKAISK